MKTLLIILALVVTVSGCMLVYDSTVSDSNVLKEEIKGDKDDSVSLKADRDSTNTCSEKEQKDVN